MYVIKGDLSDCSLVLQQASIHFIIPHFGRLAYDDVGKGGLCK